MSVRKSLLGYVFDSTDNKPSGPILIIGRVKKVVMGPFITGTRLPDPDFRGPGDIGCIKFDAIYSTLSTSKSNKIYQIARPINTFVSQYPVENEIVLIVPGPTEELNDRKDRVNYYYFPPYDIWSAVNHAAFPRLDEYEQFLKDYENKPDYSGKSTPSPKFPLGRTFVEIDGIKKLAPFEGDTILQARFGQSIRFGSTNRVMQDFNTWSQSGKTGDPITIIQNSQRKSVSVLPIDNLIEDINKDGSSIYMTSTQQINLDISGFPLKSFETPIKATTQTVVRPSSFPISNEFSSAADQDQAATQNPS